MYPTPHHHRTHERPAATYDQTMQDQRWLGALVSGSVEAYEQVFLHYHEWLLRVAYGLVGSEHDAQEVVQDVMLSFWLRRQVLQVRGSLMSYLYVAVKKRAISSIRKRRTAERFERVVATRPISPVVEATDAVMMAEELSAAAGVAINHLPVKRREIFVLHRYGKMANADIATLLGVSTRTVDTQLHRAYNGLRKALAPWTSDAG
jgi:RNA polymerase sigma-70 factor, ECF subfamily